MSTKERAKELADVVLRAAEVEVETEKQAADRAVSGGDILNDVIEYIHRFVILTAAQAIITAIYIVHTHVIEACDFTPYLNVHSAVMRSGKTRFLEVLEQFIARPWLTARVSPAVLVRRVAQQQPTLLLDESDTALTAADKEYSDALRGILNSGFQRGGCSSLCLKRNGDWQPEDFQTFGAKVIAGIGDKLPPTVKDRSIPIALKRKMTNESTQRFRKRRKARNASLEGTDRSMGARPS